MPGDEEGAPLGGSPIVAGRPLHDMGILVTGGGSGIGLGISRRLLADGAAVTIVGRSAQRLEEGRQALLAAGADPASIRAHAADMSREDPCRRAMEAASELRGGLHAAIACAGEPRGQMAPVTQLDLDSWHSVFENNVVATMLTLKYAARALVRAGGGSFIAISSISSTLAARFTSPIASAKAAIDQLCRVAASELGPSNVRVNVVRPGLVQVDRQELPDDIERDFRSAVVLPRLGRPADIADVVSFLASPRATWITGQVISVDGGQTISRPFDASPWVEPVYGQDGMRGVV
jgi:NAD(P)-dependent dehydrogenase (short-subunit alcohol dehydrogenase family)